MARLCVCCLAFLVAAAALGATSVHAEVATDRVTAFPGVASPLASPMYSGYLRASAANQTFFTHYTFIHSQRRPETDPVVLWQQGSGSSFGIGFLTEVT